MMWLGKIVLIGVSVAMRGSGECGILGKPFVSRMSRKSQLSCSLNQAYNGDQEENIFRLWLEWTVLDPKLGIRFEFWEGNNSSCF